MKKFASQSDLDEKKISFAEIGKDLFAFTAEGDPNSGIIIGDLPILDIIDYSLVNSTKDLTADV